MTISKRVTARFYKRERRVSPIHAPASSAGSGQSDVRNLPAMETRSGLVASQAKTAKPTTLPGRAPTSTSTHLTVSLRDARARAEEILRKHFSYEGRTGPTCHSCLDAYPCDAVRAAQDVTAITSKLHLDRLGSSTALIAFMIDLLELGSADTATPH